MSKTVLIVEKDTGLMGELRDALAARGFGVEETTDGKGAPELIRKKKPDCVVLAVDLDAGQNGYIICKKLKSDDDLKGVPVIIIGDPKGFGQHQKLKTRAEDYVGKPLEAPSLVEHVGNLVGFPPAPEGAALEDAFDPASLVEEDSTGVDDIPIDSGTGDETVGQADPDFAMVDSMFEESAPAEAAPSTDESLSPAELLLEDESDQQAEKTVIGFMPPADLGSKPAPKKEAAPAAAKPAYSSTPSTIGDGAEGRELRGKVAELQSQVEESRSRIEELENKLRDAETELDSKRTELETARTSSGGKSDKEVFSLKDSVNKKDKEILKLKSELNEKEKEIVELREKENSLDQQVSEGSGELAKRDAQIKTLSAKADQLTADRKKTEHQLLSAREEARTATAKLSTLQGDFDALQARVSELEGELEPLRGAQSTLETDKQQLETELSEARGELEAVKSQLDERGREADEVRSQYEQAQIDLDSARNQLTSQATSFAEEMQGMRGRIGELEADVQKQEEKTRKLQARERAQQEAVAQAKQALQQATEALDRQSADAEEIDLDELAEA